MPNGRNLALLVPCLLCFRLSNNIHHLHCVSFVAHHAGHLALSFFLHPLRFNPFLYSLNSPHCYRGVAVRLESGRAQAHIHRHILHICNVSLAPASIIERSRYPKPFFCSLAICSWCCKGDCSFICYSSGCDGPIPRCFIVSGSVLDGRTVDQVEFWFGVGMG